MLLSGHMCSDYNHQLDNETEDNPKAAATTLDETTSAVHENRIDRLQVKKESGKHKHTMEVWFAGTHSDM